MADCNKKKPSDLSNLSEDSRGRLSKSTKGESISIEGIAGDKKLEAIPNYRKAPCETIAANGQNNSQIVMGRDRPSNLMSGYGGKGHAQAGSIDIVVGRVSAEINETDEQGNLLYVDPDFIKDGARIHISQKTDIDKNFQIADGNVGNSIARSGVGIKADGVRIIGREGIKLVTQQEHGNSLGGTLLATKGIDLIAGNDDSDLQPFAKGTHLKEFLESLYSDVRALAGMINSLATKQVALDAALAAHTHITACGAGPGIATPSIELAIAATSDAASIVALDFPSHAFQLINTTTAKIDYLTPGGAKYILSKYNHTN